jgi:hypothetical protein
MMVRKSGSNTGWRQRARNPAEEAALAKQGFVAVEEPKPVVEQVKVPAKTGKGFAS